MQEELEITEMEFAELKSLRERFARLDAPDAMDRRGEAELLGFKKAVQTMQLGVTIKTIEGKILYINPAEARMHGYTVDELIGRDARIFALPADWKPMTIDQIKAMRSWRRERLNLRKDGSVFPVQLMSDVITDVSGEIIEIITTCEDITERTRIETALRESESNNKALLNAIPDPMFYINRAGKFLAYQTSRAEDLALPPDAFLGKRIQDVFPAGLAEQTLDHVQQALATGEIQVFEYELQVPLPDGILRYFECRMVPCREDDVLAIVRDITGRHQAEDELKKSHEQLKQTLGQTVNALASTVETRDPYTAGHQRRLTQLACAIARELDLPEHQIDGLRIAGLLHDIGKITVPAEILSKPGKLSEGEFIIIKSHSQIGHDILEQINFPWPVAQVILQHHERMDGSGYPRGLTGEEIMLEARILAVADVVEAMISHRPYRPTRGREMALDEIRLKKGQLYDPMIAETCLNLFQDKNFDFE